LPLARARLIDMKRTGVSYFDVWVPYPVVSSYLLIEASLRRI
jgi:hypothetical protein